MTTKEEDFYQILGLPRGGESITQNEIKRAYHKCALKYHPDKHANSSKEDREHAIKKFKEVNRAFEVLRDQEKRNAYDSPKDHASFSFSFGAEFDEFQMFHQFMREEFMFHMSRGGRIYQGSSDDSDEDYTDDDEEEEFYYSYGDDYDYIYEGDYPESAEQRRYDENKRRYEAKLARRKANKKKEKKGKPFTEMTDAEIDAFWDNNNAKEEESNSNAVSQSKNDGQGKRSAKSKKQKALQAKKEAKLKKLQRKQELEKRNAELKKQEKANDGNNNNEPEKNNLDASSSGNGSNTTTSKKKKKKKKKNNNNSNSTTTADDDNNKGDTKTSMKKNTSNKKSSNSNNNNNNLTTDSDEDDTNEKQHIKEEINYRSARDTTGFIPQEANIFILDKEKLQQIVAMGFPDTDLNATALFESNNNVELALEIILKKTAKESKRRASQETRNDKGNYPEKGSHDKGLPKEEDRPVNYKSKLCQNIIQNGSCRYGDSCHYAHSKAELRKLPPRPKDWDKEKSINDYNNGDDSYGNSRYNSNPANDNKNRPETSPIKVNSPTSSDNNNNAQRTELGTSPSTSSNNWASKLKNSPMMTRGSSSSNGNISADGNNLRSRQRPPVNNDNIQLEFNNNSYNRNSDNNNNDNNNRNVVFGMDGNNNDNSNQQWAMNKVQRVPPPGFNTSVNSRNINNNNNPSNNNQNNNDGWGNMNFNANANDTLIPTGLNASLYDMPDTSSSLFSPEPQQMVNMDDEIVLDLSPAGSPDRNVNSNNPLYNNGVGSHNNVNDSNNSYNSSQQYDSNLQMHNNQFNQQVPLQQQQQMQQMQQMQQQQQQQQMQQQMQQQQQQQQQQNNLIGSKITLIDGRDIRYEGILAEIRVEDGTVVLQSVVSLGTEDRLSMGGPIPGSNQIYPFMVFTGDNIKDLRVINDKQTIIEKMKDNTVPTNMSNNSNNNNHGMSYASQAKEQPQHQRSNMYRDNVNNNMNNVAMSHNNMPANVQGSRSGDGDGNDISKYPSSFVFVCNNRTEEECIGLGVFANTKNSLDLTKRHISLGSLIFLVNFESRKIQGVFQAASVPQLRIVQNASFTARFPVQVRVHPVQPLKAGILPPGPHRFGPSSPQRTKAYLDILGISIDEIDLSPKNVVGVYNKDSYGNNRWDNDRGGSRRYGSNPGPIRCIHCAQSKNARIRDVVSKTHRSEDCRRVNVNKNSMRR